MRTWPATNLLIRLDPRARGALQQQIYAGIRRAILDGVVAPGTRLPSSRAVAEDLGVSRTTAVLALEQLLAEGYLATRRGSGTFVAQDLPDDLPQGRRAPADAEPEAPAAVAPGDRPGGAADGRPAARRARRGRSASGRRALDLFPVRLWGQLVTRRVRAITSAQLDYGEPAGTARAPRGHRRPRPGGARDAVRSRSGGDRARAPSRASISPAACCSTRATGPGWRIPGYPGARSALVGAGRPDPAGAGRCGGPRRRRGRARRRATRDSST